jgi:hypothetical protein
MRASSSDTARSCSGRPTRVSSSGATTRPLFRARSSATRAVLARLHLTPTAELDEQRERRSSALLFDERGSPRRTLDCVAHQRVGTSTGRNLRPGPAGGLWVQRRNELSAGITAARRAGTGRRLHRLVGRRRQQARADERVRSGFATWPGGCWVGRQSASARPCSASAARTSRTDSGPMPGRASNSSELSRHSVPAVVRCRCSSVARARRGISSSAIS